jgi:Mg2+ and Co2+ transporter CorA
MPLAEDLDKLSQSWESNQHNYPAHIKVEKLEIVGDNDNDPVCVEEEIDVSDRETLTQWLGWDDNSLGGPSGPSLKLLLILVEHGRDTDFLTNEEDAKAVTEAFRAARLPLAGLAAHITLSISFAKAPSRYIRRDGAPSLLSRYYFSHHAYCITWAFDHATKNTRAALIYRNYETGFDSRIEFAKVLTNNAKVLDQPMLLGLVAMNFYLEETNIQQTNYADDLRSIQQSTELFDWDAETGKIVEVDASGLDYGRISRVLASLLARVSDHRSLLSVALGFAALMLQEHSKTCHKSSSGVGDTWSTEVEMEEAIETVKGRTEILLGENQCVRDDLKDMMSAIYNLIAQKDSNVGLRVANHSRTLAIESKRDSSSMKTIAAVTMAFLPGTFVASFFAMPMFDWNKPPGHNVNTHAFWIYWTVTIPLTASVLLLWWTWLRFKTVREIREDTLLAEMDKLDEKRNDGRSGGDSQLDSNSDTRTHTQSSLYSCGPERSETMSRRIRSVLHNSSSHHGEEPKISAPPERPITPLRSLSVLQQSRSIVPRSPSIETIHSQPASLVINIGDDPTMVPLPPSMASRVPSAASLRTSIAP